MRAVVIGDIAILLAFILGHIYAVQWLINLTLFLLWLACILTFAYYLRPWSKITVAIPYPYVFRLYALIYDLTALFTILYFDYYLLSIFYIHHLIVGDLFRHYKITQEKQHDNKRNR